MMSRSDAYFWIHIFCITFAGLAAYVSGRDLLGIVIASKGLSDLDALETFFEGWERFATPCSVKLRTFYTHSEIPAHHDELSVQVQQIWSSFEKLHLCFERVEVVNVTLPDHVRLDYPAGPNYHFLSIFFSDEALVIRNSLDFIFYTELDVSPLKTGWVDRLLAEVLNESFWVKGSGFDWHSLDHVSTIPQEQSWLGHLNFNALFNLQDKDFITFLRVVVEYEPPDHFWKPLDLSVWRTLHAFPYTWPLYRRYRHKFVSSNFISNIGGQVPEIQLPIAKKIVSERDSALVHGSSNSAGIMWFHTKNWVNISWTDEIGYREDICVMFLDEKSRLKAQSKIDRYFPGPRVQIIRPFLEQQASKFQADDLASFGDSVHSWIVGCLACPQKYVLAFSSTAFTRSVLKRDLMWLGKPILQYKILYQNSFLGGAGYAGKQTAVAIFRAQTIFLPSNICQCLHNLLVDYEHRLPKMTCVPVDPLYIIGTVLWHHFHDEFWWIPHDLLTREMSTFPHPLLIEYT